MQEIRFFGWKSSVILRSFQKDSFLGEQDADSKYSPVGWSDFWLFMEFKKLPPEIFILVGILRLNKTEKVFFDI